MPTTKALSASKFFGKDRYEYYLNELLTQQKVGGNVLSKSQVKEGFLKRKDKISFEKFVEKLLNTKAAKSAITPPEIKSNLVAGGVGLGSRGGGLVKSPTEALEKYISGVSKPQKMGGIEDDISKITKSVISIAEILSGQKKLKDSSTSYDRRKAEQEKRSLAESKLEKRFDGLKKAAEKILAPVKSLLDKIINFLVTVFLGRVVYKLLEWFGDPKNADKVKSISRFLKDFGPAILTAFVLFGTSFGRLTLGLTKMIGGFIFKIGKVLIPQLLKLIARNPKVALAAGLFTAGATIPAMFPGTVDEQEKKTKSKPGSTEDKIKALEQQKANLNPLQKMQGVGSEIDEQLSALKTGQTKSYGFSGGGLNFKGMMGGALGSSPEKPQEMPNGFVSGEKGVDKVPAMLSDGEFVMSVGAVQKYGVDTLEGMNAAGGGTNKPKMMGGKTYAAGGGKIGEESQDNKDTYLVRAVKELLKVLNEKFGGNSDSSSNEGSNLGEQISSIAKKINYLGSKAYTTAESGINTGMKIAGAVANKAKPVINTGMKIAGAVANKAKPTIQSLPSMIDYGSLYLGSQLGGMGGSITEADLSKQTQDEYKKAFARAKADLPNRMSGAQSVVNHYEGLLKGPNLSKNEINEAKNRLANAKSELNKYKKGLVNVEYKDFNDEKGKLSPAAEAAQKTLGAVWASSTKEGGVKIEKEPYDFPLIKDPIGLMRWKQLNNKEKLSWLDQQNPNSAIRRKLDPRLKGSFNKWGKQDIAEAAYTLNPFATPVETDVQIGGKPRAKGLIDTITNKLDNPLFSMARGAAMNMVKGKERNVVTGEAEKGSLMDSMFPSNKSKPTQLVGTRRQQEIAQYKAAGMVNYSAAKISTVQRSRAAPPIPPPRPAPKIVSAPSVAGSNNGGRGSSGTGSQTPSFSARNSSGGRSKQETLGLMR